VQGDFPVRADALGTGDQTGKDRWARRRAKDAKKRRLSRQRRLLAGPKPAKTKGEKKRYAKIARHKARKTIKQLQNWTEQNDEEEEKETLKRRATHAAHKKAKAKANNANIQDRDTGSTAEPTDD
jgi:FKBP-type peptidyl-prolyl cis-trans isomerase